MEIKKVELRYELEEKIPLSYGYKLRGFFANKFKHILFHHHKEDGSLRYKYPLIQYKIINNKPVVIALQEGCEVVTENFLNIEELNLNGQLFNYPTGKLKVVVDKLFVEKNYEIFPYRYKFLSPWVALNQKNYNKYKNQIKKYKSKVKFLSRILIGNILSFAKGIDWWVNDKIIVMPDLNESYVNFKGNKLLGFKGIFYSNIFLPEFIGLGKLSSRGFGTITRKIIE